MANPDDENSIFCRWRGIAIEADFSDILPMLKGPSIALVLLFAATSFGQAVSVPPAVAASEAARAEFMNAKYWSKIGGIKDEQKGFTLFSRNLLPNPEGQIELWVKVIPNNLAAFNRRYDLPSNSAFVLQYATVDCTRHSIMIEKTAVYNAANVKLTSGSAVLTPRSARDRVKPGSIGAEIYESVCVRLESP